LQLNTREERCRPIFFFSLWFRRPFCTRVETFYERLP
jgi:hypothetical protein